MILGFTGSRRGVTTDQVEAIKQIIDDVSPVASAHHGDAIGADAIFHEICLTKSVPVQLHPAQNAKDRAYCKGAELGDWHNTY